LSQIAALKKPSVGIDFFNPDFDFDCVIVDNFYMGFYTTNLLIRNGCKKIGFVGNPEQTNSIMDRHYGYAKALNRARLPVREDWLIVNNDTETNLFSLNFPLPEERLDAYVCHCDMAAYYLIMKLEHAGIRVPEQTSVVSFDNTVLGETVTPKLSSMSVDKKDFANTSYELLTQRIRDGAAPARKQYMNCRMFMRDSVRLSNVE
jgi:LacI family transcriptional regulator